VMDWARVRRRRSGSILLGPGDCGIAVCPQGSPNPDSTIESMVFNYGAM
jgi:hypothetical protein